MKATEFVKKYGWDNAKKWCITQAPYSADYYNITGGYVRGVKKKDWQPSENCVSIEDVKNLVNAYELVESYGGLEKSKLKVQGNRLSYKKTADLWKAVELVESVNE